VAVGGGVLRRITGRRGPVEVRLSKTDTDMSASGHPWFPKCGLVGTRIQACRIPNGRSAVGLSADNVFNAALRNGAGSQTVQATRTNPKP